LPDENRALEPPDPIPNSEVKRRIADDSVGSPHVKVGHRQALFQKPRPGNWTGFFCSSSVGTYAIAAINHDDMELSTFWQDTYTLSGGSTKDQIVQTTVLKISIESGHLLAIGGGTQNEFHQV
jgi:hypothetical protein